MDVRNDHDTGRISDYSDTRFRYSVGEVLQGANSVSTTSHVSGGMSNASVHLYQ